MPDFRRWRKYKPVHCQEHRPVAGGLMGDSSRFSRLMSVGDAGSVTVAVNELRTADWGQPNTITYLEYSEGEGTRTLGSPPHSNERCGSRESSFGPTFFGAKLCRNHAKNRHPDRSCIFRSNLRCSSTWRSRPSGDEQVIVKLFPGISCRRLRYSGSDGNLMDQIVIEDGKA
jgi:hypothetical protein